MRCPLRVEAEIKKWGNGLALHVTGAMAELPQLKAGTKVTVDVSSQGLVVRPADQAVGVLHLPYSEDEILAGFTPEKAHADELPHLLPSEVDI